MKYLKTINELNTEMITEKSNWQNYVIAFGLTFILGNAISNKFFPSTDKVVQSLIVDINSIPTETQKIYINNSREMIIKDIMINTRISEEDKVKVIREIRNIQIIATSEDNINKISKGTIACYLTYLDGDNNYQKAIFISNTRMREKNNSLSHEIFHLVDDILGSGNKFYSELTNIAEILDKDIITKTPLGIKKLEAKIKYFMENTKPRDRDGLKERATKEEPREVSQEEYDQIVELFEANKKRFILQIRDHIYADTEYMIKPSEIFVRYNGMKKFLLREGFIKDINDPVTKDIIKELFKSPLLDDLNNYEIDHFELLFFLNIDPSTDGETEEESKALNKLNSIVTNYKDYKNNNIA